MSWADWAFTSDVRTSETVWPLSTLPVGAHGVVADLRSHDEDRISRLFALGITPGASVAVLQTFPAIVFTCDQTELAIERVIGDLILVRCSSGTHASGARHLRRI